jgi:hypothetical protein
VDAAHQLSLNNVYCFVCAAAAGEETLRLLLSLLLRLLLQLPLRQLLLVSEVQACMPECCGGRSLHQGCRVLSLQAAAAVPEWGWRQHVTTHCSIQWSACTRIRVC